jgi:sec-independent protein translocase protein TatC
LITRLAGFLKGSPQHPVGPDGRMALSDHLRELRARIIRATLMLVVAIIVMFYFYDQLYSLVLDPYTKARSQIDPGVKSEPVINGVTSGLMFQLKLCGVAGIVVSSPYWLYQIWAFIVPGLHSREKKYSRMFAAVAGPLFLGGVALGYYVLPKGLTVLISFVPNGVTNLIDFGRYFSFEMRMLLIFGVAMEIPLFVVLLNLAGVISGRTLAKNRPWIIIGTMVFAAVATPSTDPFSMLMLAIPMLFLFAISEIIARISDRVRGRGAHSTDQWDDDQVSPI